MTLDKDTHIGIVIRWILPSKYFFLAFNIKMSYQLTMYTTSYKELMILEDQLRPGRSIPPACYSTSLVLLYMSLINNQLVHLLHMIPCIIAAGCGWCWDEAASGGCGFTQHLAAVLWMQHEREFQSRSDGNRAAGSRSNAAFQQTNLVFPLQMCSVLSEPAERKAISHVNCVGWMGKLGGMDYLFLLIFPLTNIRASISTRLSSSAYSSISISIIAKSCSGGY